MLKQTTGRPEDWNEPLNFGNENSLVNLGSFYDIIYHHDYSKNLCIHLSWALPRKINIADQYDTDALTFFFVLMANLFGTPIINAATYILQQRLLT